MNPSEELIKLLESYNKEDPRRTEIALEIVWTKGTLSLDKFKQSWDLAGHILNPESK